MLGSLQDAEDALQETLPRGLAGASHAFEERPRSAPGSTGSPPTAASTRDAGPVDAPPRRGTSRASCCCEPTGLDEVVWLEPYPDARLREGPSSRSAPRRATTSSNRLARVRATLQLLPPRQLAVLVLRDVLGFPAREVADMLGTTVESVTSALKRARAGLHRTWLGRQDHLRPAAVAAERADLVERFTQAWEAADTDAVVALLTDDAFITMPPMPYRYDGRDLVGRFCAGLFDGGRRFELVPTPGQRPTRVRRAYLAHPDRPRPGVGLYVLTLAGDRITTLTRFEPDVLPWFDLPPSLPG